MGREILIVVYLYPLQNNSSKRIAFYWSADQCCLVFPLNCGHCCFSGQPNEPFHSIFRRFIGRQNGAHVHSSAPTWCLDRATIFSWSAAEFLLFGRPVEWALTLYIKGILHKTIQKMKTRVFDTIDLVLSIIPTFLYWDRYKSRLAHRILYLYNDLCKCQTCYSDRMRTT